MAFSPHAVIGDAIFIDKESDFFTDLQRPFGDSDEIIVQMMQHRLDELPVHSIVYYHSYNQGVLQRLHSSVNLKLQLSWLQQVTGNQQDCLGMTPLHILTCSSVHDLELYRLIIENYPTNLITDDMWGALPLLMHFGDLHQLRLSSSCLRVINHFPVKYSTAGQ